MCHSYCSSNRLGYIILILFIFIQPLVGVVILSLCGFMDAFCCAMYLTDRRVNYLVPPVEPPPPPPPPSGGNMPISPRVANSLVHWHEQITIGPPISLDP